MGPVVIRRRLRRADVVACFEALPPCLVGMEACATGHYWGREIKAFGHDVQLMPPSYVRAYVKRQKNEAADTAAICEAVIRPSMRFVPVKSAEQQRVLMLYRTRELLIRQRTMLINALRANLAEFGIGMRQGMAGFATLAALVEDADHDLIPEVPREALLPIVARLRDAIDRVRAIELWIHAWHRSNAVSRRQETIPGIGPITASVIVATITDPNAFISGCQLAA